MHFDHSNEKRYAFPRARHIYSLENYFIGGRCRLAWRVLTQAEENHRRETHKILVKCFKNFVYPWLARKKKRQIANGISKKKKVKLKQPAFGQVNSNLFNKEFVSSFFPVNLR